MIDWGSVPAYFGGIALILTVTIIVRDRRERIRAQADRIAAWVQRAPDADTPHRVLVKNAGDLPCVDVTIGLTAGYQESGKVYLFKIFGEATDGWVKPRYWHAVGPGETVVVFETPLDVAVRSLSFTDATGRQWMRRPNRLVRLGFLRSRWPVRLRQFIRRGNAAR